MKYTFIHENAEIWPVRLLARLLDIHPSGYYVWLQQPEALHGAEEHRLSKMVRELWQQSGGEYGYRQIFEMLRDTREVCSLGRARALLKSVKSEAQSAICEPLSPADAVTIPATQDFHPPLPNLLWIVGASAIPTEEGSVNLAIIIDAFSGRTIHWGLHESGVRELQLSLLQGLLLGRQVQQKLLVHFDRATRYTHKEWRHALRFIDPERKISRRGPFIGYQHVASFFQWLLTEKIGEATPVTVKELQNQLLNFMSEFNCLQRPESALHPLLLRISDMTYGGFDCLL
ncbi:hypothetical protein [Xenorhabdus szentirmaii]|uniref:hypothetical protein n=1 Tax=Xenorhabdus szentirmaii TaxID=290112 RepID=UPI00199C55D2|nr:hypothetical protein [Xenorhabdus sp. CUL]MBD2794181.1 hypothetical protein [Xenorhabdus sp. CUL]